MVFRRVLYDDGHGNSVSIEHPLRCGVTRLAELYLLEPLLVCPTNVDVDFMVLVSEGSERMRSCQTKANLTRNEANQEKQ